MKRLFPIFLVAVALMQSAPAEAKPVDLTGLSCVRMTNSGPNTWEFYGDIAVRVRDKGQGRPQRYVRVGDGAYERYSHLDGKWDAVYYFFDAGDGIQMRVFSRPGLSVREDNPRASWDKFITPFAAQCVPLWEAD